MTCIIKTDWKAWFFFYNQFHRQYWLKVLRYEFAFTRGNMEVRCNVMMHPSVHQSQPISAHSRQKQLDNIDEILQAKA